MKIVVYGAESTGKTSLAKALADHYQTTWAAEYAREYLQKKYDNSGEICAVEDLIPIALGQIALEQEALANSRNNLIFCDTNPYQTYYYGTAYYRNFKHPGLWKLASAQHYDFYLLTYIDTPWVEDDLRDKPEEREQMHRLFKNSLEENNFPYLLVKGSLEKRLKKATEKIDELIKANPIS